MNYAFWNMVMDTFFFWCMIQTVLIFVIIILNMILGTREYKDAVRYYLQFNIDLVKGDLTEVKNLVKNIREKKKSKTRWSIKT